MNYLAEFLGGRVHPEWWAYRVVAWYCGKRGIELPKGRCHFGEIFLFYAPAYLSLGLFFKMILGILKGVWFILKPPLLPLRWFIKKVNEDFKVRRARFWKIYNLTLIVLLGLLIPNRIYDWPSGRYTLLMLGIPLTIFVGSYLAIWYLKPIGPIFTFCTEAAQRISVSIPQPVRPTPWRIATAPVKGVASGGRHSITGMKTIWTIIRSTWRQKVCPLIEYVEPPNTNQVSLG